MTLYDIHGQPAYCGNCVWGQLVAPFKRGQTYYGNPQVSGGQVYCQLNPKRGDWGFPIMEFTDHCSHHPALTGTAVSGLTKADLPITVALPTSDWLQGECLTCGAEPGEFCNKAVHGRRRNGVHITREGDAWRAGLPECSYCGAEPGKHCIGPGSVELRTIHYAREKEDSYKRFGPSNIRNL